MPHQPDLRKSATERFDRDWDDAIAAGDVLLSAFEHLSGSIATLAEHGSRQTLTFKDELVQQWWVAFQESKGDMIPRSPELPPIPAREEQIA